MSIEIRRARDDELDVVLEILSDAARRVLARGFERWPDPFPPDRVRPNLERGEIWLALDGQEAVATMTLQWEDERFWGKQPPVAGYVHRLAVRSSHTGRGIGVELVEWALGEVRAAGREFVRLDTPVESAGLRAYYESLGFELRGEVHFSGWAAVLYERRVG